MPIIFVIAIKILNDYSHQKYCDSCKIPELINDKPAMDACIHYTYCYHTIGRARKLLYVFCVMITNMNSDEKEYSVPENL